jgi:hypothetical protein
VSMAYRLTAQGPVQENKTSKQTWQKNACVCCRNFGGDSHFHLITANRVFHEQFNRYWLETIQNMDEPRKGLYLCVFLHSIYTCVCFHTSTAWMD